MSSGHFDRACVRIVRPQPAKLIIVSPCPYRGNSLWNRVLVLVLFRVVYEVQLFAGGAFVRVLHASLARR